MGPAALSSSSSVRTKPRRKGTFSRARHLRHQPSTNVIRRISSATAIISRISCQPLLPFQTLDSDIHRQRRIALSGPDPIGSSTIFFLQLRSRSSFFNLIDSVQFNLDLLCIDFSRRYLFIAVLKSVVKDFKVSSTSLTTNLASIMPAGLASSNLICMISVMRSA